MPHLLKENITPATCENANKETINELANFVLLIVCVPEYIHYMP